MRNFNKERIVGSTGIIFGISLLIFQTWSVQILTNLPNESYRLSLGPALLMYHHGFINAILIFGAGMLLLFSHRLGWSIALAVFLMLFVNLADTAFKNTAGPYTDQSIAIFGVFGLFFMANTIVLLSKDLRTKYLTLQSVLITSIVLSVLLVDRFLLT